MIPVAREFSLHVVCIWPSCSTLAHVLCRPAALEALDHNQVRVNISIPGPVRKAVDQEPAAYYFATVQRVQNACHRPILQHHTLECEMIASHQILLSTTAAAAAAAT